MTSRVGLTAAAAEATPAVTGLVVQRHHRKRRKMMMIGDVVKALLVAPTTTTANELDDDNKNTNKTLVFQNASSCRLLGCCRPLFSLDQESWSSSSFVPPSVLYCSPIADNSSADSSSSEDSESEANSFFKVATTTTRTTKVTSSWQERLLGFSNFASFLCVLDCTILPALIVLLPLLLGIFSASSTASGDTGSASLAVQMESWLHNIGHAAALYFVLPVGCLATTTHYWFGHRTAWITALGWTGLCLIFLANGAAINLTAAAADAHHHHHHGAECSSFAHHHHDHYHHHHNDDHNHHYHHHDEQQPHQHHQPWWQQLNQAVAHDHGMAHRATNLTGCGLLILSNLISRRRHHHAASCGFNCGR